MNERLRWVQLGIATLCAGGSFMMGKLSIALMRKQQHFVDTARETAKTALKEWAVGD